MAVKKEIKRISVLRAGIISGLTMSATMFVFMLLYYLILSFIPFPEMGHMPFSIHGMFLILLIVLPIFYGILGFLFGVLWAGIYNLIAKSGIGLVIELEDVQEED